MSFTLLQFREILKRAIDRNALTADEQLSALQESLAVLDALTPNEMVDASALDELALERVVQTTGLAPETVRSCFASFRVMLESTPPTFPHEQYTHLCQPHHSKLMAGRCPWCGLEILSGAPSSDWPSW